MSGLGAVVRDADTMRVVAWLRDIGEGERSPVGGAPSPVLGGLGAAAIGLQVLNMGIMIAGFAFLANRISGVSRQCDTILQQTVVANNRLEWLREANLGGYQARMLSALEAAHTAQRLGESVLPYDTAINDCTIFFGQMLDTMMRRGDVFRDSDMFEMLLMQSAVAVVARARTQWLMMGPDAGLDALDRGRQAHVERIAAFQSLLRDKGPGSAVLLEMTVEQRGRLKQVAALLRHVSQQLSEKREEMAACVAAALPAPADVNTLRRLEAHPTAWLVLDMGAEAPVTATPA
jgi:hypothetical protein